MAVLRFVLPQVSSFKSPHTSLNLQPHITTEDSTIVSDFSSQVKERTFPITGPSTGSIGAETALLLGRSFPKIQPVIDTIDTISPSSSPL
ncbi:hypothetical protein F5882DRAFT_464646 [Hyaloscypha sp. PMI_1271]|nr:hypothetical protein F5882DRAFT_464646 [Hyaloscypha sp. PMI_1271]